MQDVEILSAVSHEFVHEGYVCPRCKATLEELPTTCPICSLACVASPHLARSFHHLFPVPLFEKIQPPPAEPEGGAEGGDGAAAPAQPRRTWTCNGCSRCIGADEMRFRCPRPQAAAAAGGGAAAAPKEEAVYCVECDVFIHDVLHNAPPATTSHHAAAADAAGGGGGGGGGAAAAAVPAIKDGGSDVG